jgi:hypothetical protein
MGAHITRSELEVGGELLYLYLESKTNGSVPFQTAQDLVFTLQQSRHRLLKISSQFTVLESRQISVELGQIKEVLSHATIGLVSESVALKRNMVPDLLASAIAYWQELTGKSKFDLARESRLWNVEVSADGWMRTRTLDKYLSPLTLPERPRFDRVVQTVEYVLCESDHELPQRQSLFARLEEFQKLQ